MTGQLEAEIIALTSGLRFTQPLTIRTVLLQQLLPQALLCQHHTVYTCRLSWIHPNSHFYFTGWALTYPKAQSQRHARDLRKVVTFPGLQSSLCWMTRKFSGFVQRVRCGPAVSKEDHKLGGGTDLLVMLPCGGLQGCPAPEQR